MSGLPLAIGALVLGALATARLLRSAALRRAHRDVGGFVGYLVVALAVALLALSVVVAPGAWLHAYRAVIRLYNGG